MAFTWLSGFTVDGNVGIGVEIPSGKLEVKSASSVDGITITSLNSPYLKLMSSSVDNTRWNWALRTNYNVAGSFEIMRAADGGEATDPLVSVLAINTLGYVGIGVHSPVAKLSLGASADAIKFLLYDAATNYKYGFGIQTDEFRQFYPDNGHLSIGTIAAADGSTFSEKVQVNSAGAVIINNAIAPSSLALLNIGSTGAGETRAIDIDGSWSGNESKSITFAHGSALADMVGQINCEFLSTSSRIRWGKLYHGANSSTYTMSLTSVSTTSANLSVSGIIYATGGNSTEWNTVVADGPYLPLSGGTIVTGAFKATGALVTTGGISETGVGLGQASNYAHAQFSGSVGGYIDFSEPNVDWSGRIIYTHSSDDMKFYTATTEVLKLDSSNNATFTGTINSGAITSTGQIQASSFYDGYITWAAAQINRYGSAVELQYTPTNASTLVKIGANGSNPTTINAYTGALQTTSLALSAKGTSAATIASDGVTTLTTKSYVDGLVTGVPVYKGTWAAGTTGVTSAAISGTVITLTAAPTNTIAVGDIVTATGIAGLTTTVTVVGSQTSITVSASVTIAITETVTFSPVGGFPDLTAAALKILGNYYIVDTTGVASPNGAGVDPDTWNVGDWAIFSDITPGVGTDLWQKIDNTSVISGSGTGTKLTMWAGASGANSETLTDSRFSQTATANVISGPSVSASEYSLAVENSAGADALLISSSGVVTIPTSASHLYVSAAAGIYAEGSIKARGGVMDDVGPLGLGGNNTVDNLVLTSNTSAKFSGLLDITGAVDAQVRIYGGTGPGNAILELLNETTSNTEGFRIEYKNQVGDTYLDNIWDGGVDANPAIRFRTKTNGTAINAMTIAHGGNVGIGTISPGYALDVTGNISARKNVFQDIDTKGGYIMRPWGANYLNTQTNVHTGAIKITLPTGAATEDDMIKFTIDIYQYVTNESLSVDVGGYVYREAGINDSWRNVTAIVNAKSSTENYTVRFGDDGTNHCVWIGELNTVWNHPNVIARDFYGGFSVETEDYLNEWDISFEATSFSHVSQTQSNNFPLSSGGTSGEFLPLSAGSGFPLTGALYISSAKIANEGNTDIDVGTEVIAQVAIADFTAAFFDFVVKKGTNVRAGTVFACNDGTLVEYAETSTVDLGDTSDLVLTVDISAGNMRLLGTAASVDWSVKSLIRAL